MRDIYKTAKGEASLGKPSFTVDKEIHRKFRELAEKNRINQSAVIENFMREFVEKYENREVEEA